MTKRHWLQIAEYITITASVGGTIATVITKQVILTATPLTLGLALNAINRQRQRVEIYQPGEAVKVLNSPQTLSGEDVLPGFSLNFSQIWN